MRCVLAMALSSAIMALPSTAGAEHDVSQWLTWRGARTLPRFDVPPSGCVEIKTGDRGEVGLSCVEIEHVGRGKDAGHVYRVLVHQRVYVVRVGRVEKVFDQSVSVVPLDTFDGAPHAIVAIAAGFSADGRTVEVVDDPKVENACAKVQTALDEKLRASGGDEPSRRWLTFDRDLTARVCRGMGRYEWNGARFARTSTQSSRRSPPGGRSD